MTRKKWLDRKKLFEGTRVRTPSEATIIRENADWLIERLYLPHKDGYRLNAAVLPPGVAKEPINWGDLGAMPPVRFGGDGWLLTIEEAAPDCPCLRTYIEDWLRNWGWDVTVQTEW